MNTDTLLRNLSLLTARVVLGGSIAAHGAQKLFGAFEGPGMDRVTQMMESFGFHPGERYARALAATELGSGTLIAIGALGPVGPAMLLAVMLSAIELVHRPKGYFNDKGGFEMNTMYITTALLLANEGYGTFSLDALLGLHEKTRPTLAWTALIAGAIGARLMLNQRTASPPAPASTQGQVRTERAEIDSPAAAT